MKKSVIILAAIILIVGIAGFMGYPMYKEYLITKDPINHIMYSFANNEYGNKVNATIDVGVTMDKEEALKLGVFDTASENPEKFVDFINAILGKASFKYDIISYGQGKDFKSYEIEEDLYLEYDGKELIGIDMNLKPYTIKLFSEKLYDKAFEVDGDSIIKLASGMDVSLDELDVQKYIDILLEEDALLKAAEKNEAQYVDAIRKFLDGKVEKLGKGEVKVNVYGEEKSVNTTNYKINMSVLEIYDLYAEILKVAKYDKDMKALVIDRVNKLVTAAKEDEFFKKLGAEVSDFDEALKELEKLDTDYEIVIDNVINEFSTISLNPAFEELKFDSSMTIAIDDNHMIRELALNMTSGFMVIKEKIIYNAYGDDVKPIDKFNDIETINAIELFKDPMTEEGQKVLQELMTNGVSELVSGEAMAAILADVETEANNNLPEAEAQQIVTQMNMFKQQLPMIIQMMSMGMGM